MTRDAWCVRCDGVTLADENGCVRCNRDDRSTSVKPQRRDIERAKGSQVRRASLAAQGHCINGSSHAKPTAGTKCDWCVAVHRYGLRAALDEMPVWIRPLNYKPRYRKEHTW